MADPAIPRAPDELRKVSIQRHFSDADGSVLYASGRTRVLCTASVSSRVPDFLRDTGRGWVTASYEMLPSATRPRRAPPKTPDGRSQEIKRLIGRSLRAAVDLEALGPRTVHIDTHVLTADGGTRTAAITGGYLALADALSALTAKGELGASPLKRCVQAVSVGLVGGAPYLDLDYRLDSTADLDLNVVSADGDSLVELQGTAEGEPFSRTELDALLELAFKGLLELREAQRAALEGSP
jgi:ribonuclease PH